MLRSSIPHIGNRPKMTDSKQLITALKAYIKRKDLGLRETAGIIGVSPSTLSHWLSADSVTIHSFNRRQLREVLGGSEALTPKRAVVSAPDVGPVMVATLGVARASTYTPSVESIGEFLDAFEDKTAACSWWPVAIGPSVAT